MLPPAPATQAIANIQAAEQRKRILAQKLAAQMAARAARGVSSVGRIQTTGRPFQNASDLRATGTPTLGLPFAIPSGRMRPAGYDASAAPTVAAAPIAGGGVGVGGDAVTPLAGAAAPAPVNAAPIQYAPAPGTPYVNPVTSTPVPGTSYQSVPNPQYTGQTALASPSGFLGDAGLNTAGGALANPGGFNSDTPLSAAAPPDPYSVMMSAMIARALAARTAGVIRPGVQL